MGLTDANSTCQGKSMDMFAPAEGGWGNTRQEEGMMMSVQLALLFVGRQRYEAIGSV